MGNKQPNLQKKQMMDMRKALETKTTTRVVALLKAHGVENPPMAKEGCQQLFYALGREGEAKKDADLEVFRKGGFPATLVAIINNHEKASEAAGWALSIVVSLTKEARTERRYENITQELIDNGICASIHNTLNSSKDEFVKENCVEAKKNIMKIETGAEAFKKIS